MGINIGSVVRGKRVLPDRILLMGVEGVGKSTWASDAPNPVFIASEDGIRHLDVASFREPAPSSLQEVMDCLCTLLEQPHDFKTLVIDSLDWLEPMVSAHVCQKQRWVNIESPGYGKGWVVALEEWRRILATLDEIRVKRGMEIILIAHTQIRTFSNPNGPDYSRYEPQLQRLAAALVKQWSDAVLFATFEESVEEIRGKMKGISTGARVVHTQRSAAWDAKNRMSLPPTLPLDYREFDNARLAQRVAPVETLLARIKDMASSLTLSDTERVALDKFVDDNKKNPVKLSRLLDRLAGRATVEEEQKEIQE